MERLAGRIILLWGWRRALLALLAGALAVLARRPSISSPPASSRSRSWSGCSTAPPATRRRGLLRRLVPGLRDRLVVRLRLFPRRPLVDRQCAAGRGRQLRLGAAASPSSACRPCWPSSTASRRALARLFWTDDIGRIAALAFGFGLAEWLRSFLFTGFPWNAIGYARHAGAAADAERLAWSA